MAKDPQAEFLKLHLSHQRALFAYLLAASRDFQKAEDLLQQVTLVLWKKFGEYRISSPYLPWAMGVARNELLHHFRNRKRDEAHFPLEALDQVGETLAEEEERLSDEARALSDCLKRLPGEDRKLLRSRYEEGAALAELAGRLNQSLAAINMRLVRIRRALLECTGKALAKEG